MRLWKVESGPAQLVASVWSAGSAGYGSTTSGAFSETVDRGESFFIESILPIYAGDPTAAELCSIELGVKIGKAG